MSDTFKPKPERGDEVGGVQPYPPNHNPDSLFAGFRGVTNYDLGFAQGSSFVNRPESAFASNTIPPVSPALNQTDAETARLARYEQIASETNTPREFIGADNDFLNRLVKSGSWDGKETLVASLGWQATGAAGVGGAAAGSGILGAADDERRNSTRGQALKKWFANGLDSIFGTAKASAASTASLFSRLTNPLGYEMAFGGLFASSASTQEASTTPIRFDEERYNAAMLARAEMPYAAARTDGSYGANDWNKYIHVNPITLFPPNSLLINPMLPMDMFSGLLVRPFEPEFNQAKHTGNTGERYVADTRPLITPNTGIKGPSVMFQVDIQHAIGADYSKSGKPTGGHSLLNGDVRIVPGTESPPDVDGVYKATIQVPDPNNQGQWLTKTSNNSRNTMFPKHWDTQRITSEVDAAWNSPNKVVNGDKWSAITPSGVKVEGFISPRTTVYPLRKP